eukprot:TRINITY_DN62131_c0_g1_i1.p1 TRINITY_DN62131_c0_g1~~TRINITY_DN62131_c0_g1_i1.p1  ORF type:complete len:693 (-),score=74.61 TRINITY_DN62131_c0_g1_i1:1201-3279(-)
MSGENGGAEGGKEAAATELAEELQEIDLQPAATTTGGPQSPNSLVEPTQNFDDDDLKPKFNPLHFWPYHPRVYMANKEQVKNEIFAGFTVAFAQLPESVAFAFLARVQPIMALHAAWWIGLTTAAFGARPGMIAGAAGPISAIVGSAVLNYGEEYVFYIVMVAGVIQTLTGIFKCGRFGRLIPHSVQVGFTNGLAIIIGLSQLHAFQEEVPDEPASPAHHAPAVPPMGPTSMGEAEAHFKFHALAGGGEGTHSAYIGGVRLVMMFLHVFITILVVHGLPKVVALNKKLEEKGYKKCATALKCLGFFPSSLIGIVFSIFVEHVLVRKAFGVDTPIIKDVGELSGAMPKPFFVDEVWDGKIPPFFSKDTLSTIWFPSLMFALVGAIECIMTLSVVSDITETENAAPNQHLVVLGVANVVAGFFGTIGGGTMLGLSMVNRNSGSDGRWRISGVVAGITVLVVILGASPLINYVPTGALVGIMVLVVYHTFNFTSVRMVLTSCCPSKLRNKIKFLSVHKIHRADAIIIAAVTVLTYVQNLAIAVAVGVVIAALVNCWETGGALHITEERVKDDATGNVRKIYHVNGPLFFSSVRPFLQSFKVKTDPPEVELHLSKSAVCDYSGMNALNELGYKYSQNGKTLHVRHLNPASVRLVGKAQGIAKHFSYKTTEELGEQDVPLEPPQHLRITREATDGVA